MKVVKVVNLTAHEVTLLNQKGKVKKVFKPSGHVARLVRTFDTYGYVKESEVDIEVVKPINVLNFDGAVIEPYNLYIVSWLFLQALKEQNHPQLHQFAAPNTDGVQKDHKGAVKGVESFLVL